MENIGMRRIFLQNQLEAELKIKPELAETVCHYSGLRYECELDNVADFDGGGGGVDGDGGGDDGGGGGVDGDDCNLSLIHWAVKHNNRRLVER